MRNSNDHPYVIAEVGANHQGDIEIAKRYINVFKEKGASAIKFQMRDNRTLFSEEAYNRPYVNDNSFGATYGEHREALELSELQYQELKAECRRVGVDFMATPFDEASLEKALRVGVDRIKIASFDCGNLPYLQQVAESGLPVVLSTGGSSMRHIETSVRVFNERGYSRSNFSLLHCVSQYPCAPEDLNLARISSWVDKFPEATIGLSDHFNGVLSGALAAMLGASVFEKHVTLDRSWCGTDHKFSLEPEGFRKFVRDIKRVGLMLGDPGYESDGTEAVFAKLGKVICAAKNMTAGEPVTMENVRGRICTHGVPVREIEAVVGLPVLQDCAKGNPVVV